MEDIILTYYTCKNFKVYELVDKQIFTRYGEFAWSFFRPQALMMLDAIAGFYGKPVLINNWFTGGKLENRGYRSLASSIGGDNSQHRLGNGFDLNVEGVSADQVRKDILKHKDDYFIYITRLEATLGGKPISWVHFDCANVPERITLLHV